MSETEKRQAAAKLSEEQIGLPFDQHQRYRIVADAIEKLRKDDSPLEVLDVGGGEGIILKFLTGDRVTVLDQTEPEEGVPGFVRGDATALPFEDGSYDYVVSVDVYEHIPPEARERYLSELRRTARKGVLLAAPFDSEVVRGAERTADEFHRSVHLSGNVWLQEHVENGLPDLAGARHFFEEREDAVSVIPNGYIPHWLAMICLTFYNSKLETELGGVLEHINAFYNEFMYGLDNAEPCYRYLLVSLKEPVEADLEELASGGSDPDRASHSYNLFGTLFAVFPMATEIKRQNVWLAQHERRLAHKEEGLIRRERRFDAQLAEYKERLQEKKGTIERKDAQLVEHKERLTETGRILAGKEAQLAEYEKRLERSEAGLARREAQINDLSRRLAEQVSSMNTRHVQFEQQAARAQQTNQQLQQTNQQLQQTRQQLKQLQEVHDNLKQRTTGLKEHAGNLKRHRDQLQRQIKEMRMSRMWRLVSLRSALTIRIKKFFDQG